MATRLPSLLDPALLFAHRGARANAPEHSIEAFTLALRLGATGVHADAWVTADDAVVLNRGPLAKRFPRRKIADVKRADLPEGFVTLEEMLAVSAQVPIRLNLPHVEAGPLVLAVARDLDAAGRLWLAHPSIEVLGGWRDIAPEIHLVNPASLTSLSLGPERHAAELAAARIDAVSLPEVEWTGGMVALFHRFDVLAFADGAEFERQLARLIDMGIDAVSGDHPERMAAVAATFL